MPLIKPKCTRLDVSKKKENLARLNVCFFLASEKQGKSRPLSRSNVEFKHFGRFKYSRKNSVESNVELTMMRTFFAHFSSSHAYVKFDGWLGLNVEKQAKNLYVKNENAKKPNCIIWLFSCYSFLSAIQVFLIVDKIRLSS